MTFDLQDELLDLLPLRLHPLLGEPVRQVHGQVEAGDGVLERGVEPGWIRTGTQQNLWRLENLKSNINMDMTESDFYYFTKIEIILPQFLSEINDVIVYYYYSYYWIYMNVYLKTKIFIINCLISRSAAVLPGSPRGRHSTL